MNKIAYITLGCPKNQVDSEQLFRKISDQGFGYTDHPDEADICIVNTCCFIDDAKKESIEAILEVSEKRRNGSKLVIMGCMGQKYRDDLIQDIPEADAVYGIDDFDTILSYIKAQLTPDTSVIYQTLQQELSFKYVKIADGCNRSCSFCVIPSIRGGFRSSKPKDILGDVRSKLESGAKEIILVAQDITGFGRDIGNEYTLSSLVRDIARIDDDFWLRLLYLYPSGIDSALVQAVSESDKVCNYFDIPVQHADNAILRSMKRGYTKKTILNTFSFIRQNVADAILRSTLIVGYPGESEEQFNALKEFVKEVKFDRLGVFKYSPQEATSSYDLGNEVPESVKEERFHEIMTIQSEISAQKNAELVGNIFRALVDSVEDGVGLGRLYSHAPEIDGDVNIKDCPESRVGQFVNIRITDAYEYDLMGEIINGF